MKRFWLLFSQASTVLLAAYFIVATLQPGWLPPRQGTISFIEAPSAARTEFAAGSLAAAAQKAMPAVVSINTSTEVKHPRSQDPWFQFFFGDISPRNQAGLGSGVIVSPEGYILTNNHVVAGTDQIEVTLADKRVAIAHIIGTDPETDLAVLKIEMEQLPVMVLGNSEHIAVGDIVLAIGNPFGVGQTVTSGIISALGRNQLGINTFENFIQTDAAINPGNSGGALINTDGNLLGINTAIYSRSGGNMGIGFAIPIATAKNVMEGLIQNGKVTRGWIGVEPNELSPELAQTFGIHATEGVIITGVLQAAPAARAGILPGDVIYAINTQAVHNVAEMMSAIAALPPGTPADLSIQRGATQLQLQVTPSERPLPQRMQRQQR